ncbi:hypothetical protein OIU74_011108, partial [Salix koriyanagi]
MYRYKQQPAMDLPGLPFHRQETRIRLHSTPRHLIFLLGQLQCPLAWHISHSI